MKESYQARRARFMPFNAKRDKNEKAIVKAFEQLGCHVTRVSGAGIPDLIVDFAGTLHWVEVKSAKGKMTPTQTKFRTEAICRGTEVFVVRAPETAVRLVTSWRHP